MPAKKVTLDSTKEKPSLASLKPDKTKGVAAKKMAVKRIAAASSSKTAVKKPKQVLAAKKAALHAVTTSPKKMPTRRVKTVAEKTLIKNAAEKTIIKKKAPKDVAKRVDTKNEFSIKLPTNMSIRAREKTLVILHALEQDFRVPLQKIAYVSGFVFLLLGASLAVSFSLIIPNNALQTALLQDTAGSTDAVSSDLTTQTVAVPVFSVSEHLPAIMTGDFTYTFSVTNAKNVYARLYSFSDANKISLNITSVYADTYRVFIKTADLKPGEYKLEFAAEAVLDSSRRLYDAGSFVVESSATSLEQVPAENVVTSGTTTTTSASSGTGATGSSVTTADSVVSNTVPIDLNNITEPRLITDGGDFSKQEIIKILAPKDTRLVEIYARPLKSMQPLFLGAAVAGTTYWYFFFDTLHVPNGEYELVARTRNSSGPQSSQAIRVKVANTVSLPQSVVVETPQTETVDSEANVTAAADETDLIIESTDSADPEVKKEELPAGFARSFSDVSELDFSDASSSGTINEEAETEIKNILGGYREELANLLKRYAVAKQSGDTLLIEVARKELQSSKQELVNKVLSDSQASHLADDVELILTDRFESLQKRIDTFEELRRSANTETTGFDTDKDGISDFDEKYLYQTDPEHVDTDNDGITDGIEIMRGFDPRDAAAEAVIAYESPQDSLALIEEETLKVETVVPVVQNDAGGKILPVFAEIRGKGLPNSYVTLYIFSTPTIVTVRTDNDGSFVYTFEKELEDGEHEVYVAVTDNTGAIMARSNAFKFIKEAQAFTPVGAAGGAVVNSESFQDFTNGGAYNIAVGLGILAFGLILLMLGVSLREKEGPITKQVAHDLKTS